MGFGTLARRRGFREYLAGLLLPRDRSKTLTSLAGPEPVAGARVVRLACTGFLAHATPCHASGPKDPLMSEAMVAAFTNEGSW